ncbi:MAG TPA: class I SAM-dependent methyltransferase, partial [Herpetosiphonaceae bacterium]|nr:class I SAM-dependent methyltransferase [Herpetosiphonaceae bacterium]
MSVSDAYDAWASSYDSDRNLTRDLDEEATRATLADLRPRSILELGCGTGKNTSFLARIGGQVRALDFSPAMLEQARAKQPGANVSFALADLTRPWPCDAAAADLIVANLVLEHIADLGFIFAE